MLDPSLFETIQLDDQVHLFRFFSPPEWNISAAHFDHLWNLHPNAFHTVKMLGKPVKTPRWQQAYGHDYQYTGFKNKALPLTPALRPFQAWCQQHIDARLNGLLVNWYDGTANHYIGPHRDAPRDLIKGSPIVTISLGEERIFRMRPYRKKGLKDLTVANGTGIILPWDTNLAWTHEVPAFKRYQGKRISITLRAFA